jgi:hypothetical protein
VPFKDLSVTATALWDNRRKHRVGDLSQAAIGFIFQVEIASDEPVDKIIEVFQKAEDGCYASDIIRNMTPMRAHVSLNGREVFVHKEGGDIPDIPESEKGWHHR